MLKQTLALSAWHYTRLPQTLFGVVKGCEQVVGKVVTSLVQVGQLYKLYTAALAYVVNYVFSVLRLLAYFKQVIWACAHAAQAVWKELMKYFYTFSTGPNTTNKLNKGLSR